MNVDVKKVLDLTSAADVKMIQPENLKVLQEACLEMLRQTGRPGMEELIAHITEMGYFIAPGSVKHHGFVGGLMCHSLETYYKAMEMREEKINQGIPEESMPVNSVVITALLHDLCKADSLRYDTESGTVKVHNCGAGHGRRSVQQIRASGFELTEDERDAIRWHMGGQSICADADKRQEHFDSHPLSDIIQRADKISIGEWRHRHAETNV